MLAASEEVEALVAALRQEVAGYVVRSIGSRELAEAIRAGVEAFSFLSQCALRPKKDSSTEGFTGSP